MTAEQWAEIRRLFFVEKRRKREIARLMGLHRATVQFALRQDHAPRPAPRTRSSKLDAFRQDIKEIMEKTPRITGVRMLEELQRRGFDGKITIVKDYLATLRQAHRREVYVRRVFHPGEAAEVDWANCGHIDIQGSKRRLSVFVMTLCYSRMLYLEFTVSQAFEEFIRCHQNGLRFFGGCPRKIFYDNLKSVVLAHRGRDIRFNPRFMDFAGFYLFEPIACNPAAGWEKGRVERIIRYIKGNFLLGRSFQSLEEINAKGRLWRDETANRRIHRTTGKRPIDLFDDERSRLLALPEGSYDTRILRPVRVTSDCRVTFQTNTYSQASQAQIGCLEYLDHLIAQEASYRYERMVKYRISAAKLPVRKTLDDYDFSHPSRINKQKILDIFDLSFIERHSNVIFLGPTGVGKTHLAIALAFQAALANYSVRFTTAIAMINRLAASLADDSFVPKLKHYTRPRLLVIDELGYLPIDRKGADLLFQVISNRYEQGSIVLTTNRPFKKWGSLVNHDNTLASALIDRLGHHADVVIKEIEVRLNKRASNPILLRSGLINAPFKLLWLQKKSHYHSALRRPQIPNLAFCPFC